MCVIDYDTDFITKVLSLAVQSKILVFGGVKWQTVHLADWK